MFFIWCAFLSVAVFASTYQSEGLKFQFELLTQQTDVIWGFDFLSSGEILFTERQGKLKQLDLKSKTVSEFKGVPKVWTQGQGGLLDVRVKETKVFLTFSEPMPDGTATTALGSAEIKGKDLVNFRKLFSAIASNRNEIHFGSRIEFDDNGHVFITVGDRNDRPKVQDLSFHNGKIIRLNEDGSVPSDNPFVTKKSAKPEIWSVGHRSPQGLAMRPATKELWMAEMGPRGGDEVNLILPGKNYGWPNVTYGREYYGPKIGVTAKDGTEPPIIYWVPSISPSGIAFYTGDRFPKWKNDLFLGTLSGMHLRRVVLDGKKVIKQEELLRDLNLRFRNVRAGPDGYLYLSTDDGKIGRLVPLGN